MAIIKCKMCGGDLNVLEDATVCECEYCGTRQTVPSADSEKKLTLFNRAGRLLRSCEFDKAAGVFETIVADFPEEAEAYWGLVLCKYGIEYVDDPATGKKIPTCHRSSFESVEDDPNYEQACENADPVARRLYREEARQIETLRKRILEVSGKEEPYDVFISYKELDESGERTPDSVIAQDIHRTLTKEGYRVFFSRISLEGKLGVEYEPYIFAALNSAKVMIVVGTDYDHFEAVWVKNEWSRFLKLIAAGQPKTIIPVYKDMDPYDMPKELRALAAQNMGKIGAMQDLLHGVEKLLGPKKEEKVIQSPYIPIGGPNVSALLDRGRLALEDGEWDKADGFFNQVLNMDARSPDAYLGLLMAEYRVSEKAGLSEIKEPFNQSKNYDKIIRFGSDSLKKEMEELAVRNEEKLEECQKCLKRSGDINRKLKGMISAGSLHTIAVDSSGRTVAIGNNLSGRCDVSSWNDITAVSASLKASIGLRANGTVVSTVIKAEEDNGQCDVREWTDIVAISAGYYHTVGLRADGTVVSTSFRGNQTNNKGQCDVSSWNNIVEVSAKTLSTVGLRADGTIVIAGSCGPEKAKALKWDGIISISCGADYVVGLKADGTVVAAGGNAHGQCNVSAWHDIVAISAGLFHTVGLRSDGTVISTAFMGDQTFNHGQCEVYSWHDIVATSAGSSHTVGLKSDGTVVSTAYTGDQSKYFGQCNVEGWRLFSGLENLEAAQQSKS